MPRLSLLLAAAFSLSACGGATVPEPVTPDDGLAVRLAVALRIEELTDDDEQGPPRSALKLVLIREDGPPEATHLGDHNGICSYLPVELPMLFAARCWWAGELTVVTVTREGDELVSRQATGSDSAMGEQEEIARTELPSGANMEPIR